MGGIGIWQILIVALVILVLFGRGRISEMMGDFGKGIKSFKQGMGDEEKSHDEKAVASRIEGPSHEAKPAGEAAQDPQPAPNDKTRAN
ncbi:Sec-independent protein translocase protein TatA [Alteripontixanthobacter maritimus]|uniref:Sec-independent protein translocase protein TatA n=1 Tax=Alteripontixanthobacter maritimus TaxID=2161824 RepID=A0A369Q345_9SPHN|nr:twin-arginine translocase TatA/TatE family subunit [Alteripontixanthobacter maritimus]RDC59311.1 Sec-independent protein translocase protein TatA [Alteripontixanthobacter maritimus]